MARNVRRDLFMCCTLSVGTETEFRGQIRIGQNNLRSGQQQAWRKNSILFANAANLLL
jgi:hypothetical protein